MGLSRRFAQTVLHTPSSLSLNPLSPLSVGMAEPESPNPIPQPQSPVSIFGEPLDDSIQDDPLLGSGSFIDRDRNDSTKESQAPERNESNGDPEFASDSVIDAKPISMLAPGEVWSEAVPREPKVRDPEEMAKRPSWLPEGWNVETRVRSSGATAGSIDRVPVHADLPKAMVNIMVQLKSFKIYISSSAMFRFLFQPEQLFLSYDFHSNNCSNLQLMEIEHMRLVLIPIALQALLGSGCFIDPGCNDSAIKTSATERHETNGDPEFASDSVIDAKPISMLALGEVWSEAAPRAPKVRDPEEMAKRPSWLPEGWNVETIFRSSGATVATIDQYYVAPSGKRKLRSKNEVLRFLASEGEPKQESTSETDAGSSDSPGSQKKPKSSSKRKKAGAVA
ncbi:uncharacterized protein [Primulina eburnea]|uniref:uncharacterized protein isoform X2 n=1 Tax=Primulina eburnea TaxID=1245227 RepID=UPI003C6C7A35